MVETTVHIPGAPHLALLTDSHNTPCGGILRSLSLHKPDLILIAGDFVLGGLPEAGLKMDESSAAMELLQGCASLAPTYASLGNHECMLAAPDFEKIRSTGCVVLDNAWTTARAGICRDSANAGTTAHSKIIIGGLSSARVAAYRKWRDSVAGEAQELYPRPASRISSTSLKPELAWLKEMEKQEGYKILLSHHPEYYPRYLTGRPFDLILSGHAHGGQWNLFHHGVWSPGQGLWPKYTSGVHDGRFVISRGLCNTAFVPRLWNPTEIVYIRAPQ